MHVTQSRPISIMGHCDRFKVGMCLNSEGLKKKESFSFLGLLAAKMMHRKESRIVRWGGRRPVADNML